MRFKGLSLVLFVLIFIQLVNANNLNNSSQSEIQQFYRVSAETVTKSKPYNEKSKKNNHKKNRLISIIRGLLKGEVKKLENSITDSVMEEVINYYGNKLENAAVLSKDVTNLRSEFSSLNETVRKNDQNYKLILKKHQNIVNTVRNSMSNAKRMREKYLKLKYANNSNNKRRLFRNKSVPTNTRALEENNPRLIETTTRINDLKPETLKLQLIKDLETKYSSVIGNSLTNVIKELNKPNVTENEIIKENNDIDVRNVINVGHKYFKNRMQKANNFSASLLSIEEVPKSIPKGNLFRLKEAFV